MKLLLYLFISSITCKANAQKGLPSFGKIDKADLEMTECAFDKEAEACKLIDYGCIYFERGNENISLFKQVCERRVRIKILNDKGLSQANLTIPYYSYNNDQVIKKIDAVVFNLDNNGSIKTTDVEKSSIYTKRLNKRWSQLIIAFPEVKKGSVIEYKFKLEKDNFLAINDWYFQDKIPTAYSEYELKVPAVFQFTVHPVITTEPEVKSSEYPESLSTSMGTFDTKILKKSYILKNIPGIKDEPYMGSIKDYQQRLEFQLSKIDFGNGTSRDFRKNWAWVRHELKNDDDFEKQFEKEMPETDELVAAANKITNPEERMKYIYNYVKDNFKWNNIESIYTFDGLKKVWENKEGTTGDINLLLVYLLKKSSLIAAPVLFSTRENGLVNSAYPITEQFNVVMAYVKIDDNFFILDGTEKKGWYKLIPENVANTAGFIIDGDLGKWIDAIDNHKYKILIALHGIIDEKGKLTGDVLVNSSGYAKKTRVEKWIKDKAEFKQEYFTAANTSLTDVVVKNTETDSLPLEQKVKFEQMLSSSGNYKYFTTNLFTGFTKNPFLSESRIQDIDFGYQQEYTIYGNFNIPEGYVFDALPENIRMTLPDNAIVFNRIISAEDNLLNLRIDIEFNRNFYPAEDYPDFKEFYKKMLTALNEQIVIKKKP